MKIKMTPSAATRTFHILVSCSTVAEENLWANRDAQSWRHSGSKVEPQPILLPFVIVTVFSPNMGSAVLVRNAQWWRHRKLDGWFYYWSWCSTVQPRNSDSTHFNVQLQPMKFRLKNLFTQPLQPHTWSSASSRHACSCSLYISAWMNIQWCALAAAVYGALISAKKCLPV